MTEPNRAELRDITSIPREDFVELSYTLPEPQEYQAGVDIFARIREIPEERIVQLSSRLRVGAFDVMADGWSDHFSQKIDGSWRDSWKDQKQFEIALDRIPRGGI